MSNKKPVLEQEMLNDIKLALDNSCDSLEGETLSKLTKIRYEAIEKQGQRRYFNTVFGPAGGLFAASIVMLTMFFLKPAQELDLPGANSTFEDLEILTSSDNIELFEDFEFYQWLAENESSV